MTRPAALSPAARDDLRQAMRWVVRDNAAAALRLRDDLRAAAQLICEHPEIGSVRPGYAVAAFRFLPLRSHPFLVAYTIQGGQPLIARVLHTSRDIPALLGDGL